VPALNEIHMGALQGRHRDERDSEAAAMWQRWQSAMWRYRVPGAESFEELHQRVSAALQEILLRHRGESVLIVGHSASNRILLGTLLPLPLEQWPSLRPSNKSVHRIRLRGERAAEQLELALKQEKNREQEPARAAA
jgi:broad specificity phosphatase PhoE